MTDDGGMIRARYDYDPYGRRTKVQGDRDADFGYTGYYVHQASGLQLALYRAYDAGLGRFINRDPIEEDGGLNLYDYVNNDSIDSNDPLGLNATSTGAAWGGAIGMGVGFLLSGGEDYFSGGTAVLANPATVAGTTALGTAAGAATGAAMGAAWDAIKGAFRGPNSCPVTGHFKTSQSGSNQNQPL